MHNPNDIKSQDDLNEGKRSSEVLLATIEKCENLEKKNKQLKAELMIARDNFECFYNWAINNGYNDNLTIDRINPNMDYYPENCRWIPLAEQAKNTTQNNLITYNGKTMILADWARTFNIKRATISARLERGWTIDEALTKPVRQEAVNSPEFKGEK